MVCHIILVFENYLVLYSSFGLDLVYVCIYVHMQCLFMRSVFLF